MGHLAFGEEGEGDFDEGVGEGLGKVGEGCEEEGLDCWVGAGDPGGADAEDFVLGGCWCWVWGREGGLGWVGWTYATEEVLLEVELQVGVLLDGAEDLMGVLVHARS